MLFRSRAPREFVGAMYFETMDARAVVLCGFISVLYLVFGLLWGKGEWLGEEFSVMAVNPLAGCFLDCGKNFAPRCGMICGDSSAF